MQKFFVISFLSVLVFHSALAQQPSKLPAGPLRMVAIGDSLTEGDRDDDGRGGYPKRVLEMVQKIRPGSSMKNFGMSGWHTEAVIQGDQGRPDQLSQAEAVRPQVAFVWIGSNDLWYLYQYNNGDENTDAEDAQRFSNNIDTILKKLKSTGAVMLMGLLDDQTHRPIAKLTGKDSAFPDISPQEFKRMSQQVVKYNDIIRKRAAQYGAIVVDFNKTKIFEGGNGTLADDGNHPNAKGYDQIAQMWFQALQSKL